MVGPIQLLRAAAGIQFIAKTWAICTGMMLVFAALSKLGSAINVAHLRRRVGEKMDGLKNDRKWHKSSKWAV
jgi:hypothetical protein